MGIHCSSVVQIIRDELRLKCVKKRHAQELTEANCITLLSRAKKLLSKFPESAVNFIFFTVEKVFTVASPVNLQNDRIYAACGTKKRDIAADLLLRTQPTFSKSVMVSVEVSKLGYTELIFVELGVKVDGAYYRDVLLLHQMLPAIRHLAGDVFVFQQDSAPAHRPRARVEYLRHATPEFISPALWQHNSPDPVDYKIWGCVQERVYQKPIHDVDQLKQRLVEVWSDVQQTVVDAAIGKWRK